MADIILDVPLPTSVNKVRRVDWASYAGYKRWQRDADKCLMLHKQNKQAPIPHHYQILIEISYDRLRADMDNIIKALLDYTVSRGFVSDDRKRFLRRIVVEFADPAPVEGCRITLRPV